MFSWDVHIFPFYVLIVCSNLMSPPWNIVSQVFVSGSASKSPTGFFPSVCSGVVAKVVKATMPNSYSFSQEGNTQGQFPVMLETTAAVHPGGSGGAVVNSDGHMIGLVTRYSDWNCTKWYKLLWGRKRDWGGGGRGRVCFPFFKSNTFPAMPMKLIPIPHLWVVMWCDIIGVGLLDFDVKGNS